jgi:Ca-activated chloride channel family protein
MVLLIIALSWPRGQTILIVDAPPRPPRSIDPEALIEEARRHRRLRWTKVAAVMAAAIAAGTGAYAVFGAGGEQPSTVQVFKNGVLAAVPNQTVVLLVDVSGSMRASDVRPTRLDATVAATKTLLARLPQRFAVGLVSFSSTAKVVQVPTPNRRLVLRALGSLVPEAGTSLGDGLTAAVKLTVASLAKDGIRRAPGHDLPAVIVLESDGAQNRGFVEPLAAARAAKAAGLRVDGIALGTRNGVVTFGFGAYLTHVPVPPDPQTVAEIARVTGGANFTATTAARLDAIYSGLAASISR